APGAPPRGPRFHSLPRFCTSNARQSGSRPRRSLLYFAGCAGLWGDFSMTRPVVSALALLVVSGLLINPLMAQDYPTRPIRVITINGPGGTADILLRAIGQEFQKRTGQPLVVEPRPGGNFTLGARACAEAAKDGYTICMLNNEALAYNQFLYKKI